MQICPTAASPFRFHGWGSQTGRVYRNPRLGVSQFSDVMPLGTYRDCPFWAAKAINTPKYQPQFSFSALSPFRNVRLGRRAMNGEDVGLGVAGA